MDSRVGLLLMPDEFVQKAQKVDGLQLAQPNESLGVGGSTCSLD